MGGKRHDQLRGGARLLLIRGSVVAVLGFLAGFVVLLFVAWRRAGSSGLGDYLSELGAAGRPSAGPYRLAILCVAAAATLAALAWRLRAPQIAAAGYLLLSAGLFFVSATVPCAAGCPIPIRDGWSTVPNFVHFSVSGAAFAAAVGAMIAVSSADVSPALRRLSALAARASMVLYTLLASVMLIFGHGLVNGLIERVFAAVCLFWLAWAAVPLCRRPERSPPSG